jgi:hypothetical protein
MKESIQEYGPIRAIAKDLFCVEGEWYGTPFRRRMTVVRLKDASLLIHSAIRMRDKDLIALNQLGAVSTIVVPNIFHDSEPGYYAEQYPQANVYVPEKLLKKCRRRFRVTGSLEQDWPHEGELPRVSFNKSMVGESVFVHLASGTLIVTDLAFNMTSSDFKTPVERLIGKWNGILDQFGPSKLTKHVFARNRENVKEALRKISAFEFDRVIMNHGKTVEKDGKQRLLDGYKRVYGFSI